MRIIQKSPMLYFDIETQGLDPFECALRAYGILDTGTGEVEVRAAQRPSQERNLISNLSLLLMTTPEFGGWNVTEFDLKFLSVRAWHLDLHFPIQLANDEPHLGKYGEARVTVPGRYVRDLAYDPGEELAHNLGVKWSLQDVAQAMGWEPSIEMTGAEAATASITKVMAHCLDDLSAMEFIAKEMNR